jgi:hypothetical protein
MAKSITITIDISVYNVRAFVRAARERARKEGLDEEQVREYSATNLTGCAVMLFDPGSGPAGCEIQDSSAERNEMFDD